MWQYWRINVYNFVLPFLRTVVVNIQSVLLFIFACWKDSQKEPCLSLSCLLNHLNLYKYRSWNFFRKVVNYFVLTLNLECNNNFFAFIWYSWHDFWKIRCCVKLSWLFFHFTTINGSSSICCHGYCKVINYLVENTKNIVHWSLVVVCGGEVYN